MKTLNTLVNATLEIEKLRVASEVRQSHLKLQGKSDPETDELHKRLVSLESFVDGRIAELLKSHPAYPWFSKVKGIGRENIGKVVGLVRVEPENYYRCDNRECKDREIPKTARRVKVGSLCPNCQEGHLQDVPYADTISALWKFAGYSVEDGKAPKRIVGGKLNYNSQLRSMCWRLGGSLLKAKGRFYEYYLSQKERLHIRFQNEGVKIIPSSQLPKIDGKKSEGSVYISEGHLHNMCLRKMIKLFLACLFLVWRKELGLPPTTPYAIGVLKHESMIEPSKMTDR